MDLDISRWILEFILSQPLDDNILNALIGVLPVPNNDVRLEKALIIRRIQSEISNGSVSEKILEYLELMEELYYEQGVETSEAMKAAYCAVAVDCTVRFLGKDKYGEAVGRIWKNRISKMTDNNVGVASKELWKWEKQIEKAVWDETCRDDMIIQADTIAAVDAVKAFVEQEAIGPCFLEVMAKTLMPDDDDAVKEDASRGQDDLLLSSPKIDEAQESLKLSSLELRAAVKDPLPEVLHLAETFKDISAQQPVQDDDQRAPQLLVDSNGVVQANGGNEDDQHSCNHNAPPKPSLMARNDTAHVFEWNDSIDNLSGESPSSDRRFILPSPRRAKISPLKKYEFKKVSTRRKPKRWSVLEEETLRSGVQKYGVGNWKLIFDNFREIFEERDPGDLKDKWRNLTSS